MEIRMEICEIEYKDNRKKINGNKCRFFKKFFDKCGQSSVKLKKKEDINWYSRHKSVIVTNKSIEKDKEIFSTISISWTTYTKWIKS